MGMFFRQFYLQSLGHASYLVGDEDTGRGLVLDARRDVDCYFDTARVQGLRIEYAIDTHGHNDYLTGIRELAARQPVKALGYVDAPFGYPHEPVADGAVIEMGDVGLEVIHTPGHTPEHISLLIYDRSSGSEPAMMLSGGAILVGDLARPDLLGGQDEAQKAALAFCRTIQQKILWRLPDHLEVWPTHVAGSLCGGNIGSRLSTTLGYERKTNAVLSRVSSSEEFVEECIRLDNLPAVPPYWRRMRSQNLDGPALLGRLGEPLALPPSDFAERCAGENTVVLDARSPEAFAGAHISGALNVGLSSSFATWAGTVIPERAEILLILDGPHQLWDACWQLLRIGYDLPTAWLAGGMGSWQTSGAEVESSPQVTVHELNALLQTDDVAVLDVRQPAERAEGGIRDSVFVTGADLPERAGDVPDGDRPLAVVCGTGYRSSVMASWIARRGRKDVWNVSGGMAAWRRAGLPVSADP
jgi:hydroxyacylglutathione hydrolase